LNATESEPYAAATKMSKPRPYHTDRFAGNRVSVVSAPSTPSSAPSPSIARVVTLMMRPRGTPRWRPDARARAGPRSRANIFISSAEQADPAAVGRRHAARSRAPAVATTARR
jgi:hypothetical protein